MDAIFESPFILYALLGVVTVMLPTTRARALAGAGLGLAALGVAADSAGGAGSGTTFATMNDVLIGLGAAVVIAAGVLGRRFRQASDVADPVAAEPAARFGPDLLLMLGFALAAAGPSLILFAAGIFLILLSAARQTVLTQRKSWLALLVSGAALLAVALYFLFTILGSEGGRMVHIASGPFSPAAERLLVLLFGLAALLLSGLPPVHRAPWCLSLAPLSAVLLSRVLAAAMPEGLGVWESPAMLWMVAALAYGALTGRWPIVMVAGGLISLWSGLTAALFAGWVLVLWGWLHDAGLFDAKALSWLKRERWSGLTALVPVLAAPFGLAAAMRSEVLLPFLAVVAISVALGIEAGRRPRLA